MRRTVVFTLSGLWGLAELHRSYGQGDAWSQSVLTPTNGHLVTLIFWHSTGVKTINVRVLCEYTCRVNILGWG